MASQNQTGNAEDIEKVPSASPKSDTNASELALVEDLQRLQADFQNYRRRVDKERLEIEDSATAKVLLQLLNVLDDIDRAREHRELDGGFKAVANQLVNATENLGLVKFEDSDVPFDHNIHEALLHGVSADVDETKVT